LKQTNKGLTTESTSNLNDVNVKQTTNKPHS